MSDEPKSTPPGDREREEQLESLIAAYIRDLEAGHSPDRQELLKQHAECAIELKQFFAQRDRLNRLADPIREFGHDLYQSIGPGKQLSYVGNYELLEEVARGGMGVVYKARQSTLGRIVAVKMIVSGRLANEQDVQRFQSEAQAAASLKHPNIVSIHEVGQQEGWHYFSMDYVEGHDLSTVLRINLLPAKTAANYVRQMAEAIHYAHQQGILHRDLKPSNILIDQQNQVHITDFGLAMRVEAGDQVLTQTGQILGTPSYMPPEQAQGKRGLIGPSSDVYALGAILYECLTGRPPFRAESVIITIEQVIHADAASPRKLNASIPHDLETICLKCLEKESHRRYATAQLLAEDVERFLNGEPIVARPARAMERSVKWVRRHPMPAAFIVSSVVALLAMAGMGLGLYYNSKLDLANTQLLSTNQQLAEASGQLEIAVKDAKAERASAHRHLYASRMALIQVAQQNDQPARIVQLLRSVIPETEQQDDLRDFEWFYLWRKYHGEESRLRGHTGPVIAVAWSPDGKWIASGSTDRTIKIWNAITGKELRTLVGHADRVHEVAFSLDSQKVVSASFDDILKVWDITSGKELNHLRVETLMKGSDAHGDFWKPFGGEAESRLRNVGGRNLGRQSTCSAYHSGGSRSVEAKTTYAVDKVSSTVTILNPGMEIPVVSFDFPTVMTQVAFSVDGTMVAASSLDQTVRVWMADDGSPVCTLHAPDGVRSVAFSPDGSRIIAGTENRLVMQWTLPGSEERVIHEWDLPQFKRWDTSANCVTFGAGGQLIAAVCGTSALVWNSYTGQRLFTAKTGQYSRIALSPIHGWIAGAPLDRLINVQTNGVVQEFADSSSKSSMSLPHGYAISHDESLVAVASGGESVTVQNIGTGELVLSMKMPNWASSVAFSPDAKLLAAGSGQMAGAEDRGKILVREITTGQTLFEEKLPLDVWCLSFSPSGELLAAAMGVYEDSGTNLGRIRVWSTANWQTVFDLRVHTGCVWSLTFNSAGTRLASASGVQPYRVRVPAETNAIKLVSPPGELKIWDTITGEELLTIPSEKGPSCGVAFSPDGYRLATAEAGAVKICNGTPLVETPAYEPLPEEESVAGK